MVSTGFLGSGQKIYQIWIVWSHSNLQRYILRRVQMTFKGTFLIKKGSVSCKNGLVRTLDREHQFLPYNVSLSLFSHPPWFKSIETLTKAINCTLFTCEHYDVSNIEFSLTLREHMSWYKAPEYVDNMLKSKSTLIICWNRCWK